jgi:ATP dependent DNA ligase domain
VVHLITNVMQGDQSLDSFIVDAEAVAVDPSTGDLRSFQELAGRARKDVQIADVKVAVCLFLFDMMLLNGMVNFVFWLFCEVELSEAPRCSFRSLFENEGNFFIRTYRRPNPPLPRKVAKKPRQGISVRLSIMWRASMQSRGEMPSKSSGNGQWRVNVKV